MKQLLLLLVVLSSTTTQATNYYVSSTGNDANNGLSPATAWKSIKQVNGFNFAANDHILFNRGDIFNGFIRVNRSNLFFEAYGTGANPLISGFTTVSSWTNVGGNIWESNVLNAKAGVDIVTVNGEQVAPGRYPNTGYLTYQSSNSTSYTAFALPTSPSFTGGECVARKERWIMDRQAITSHSGTTLNVATSTSGYGGKNGAGLFIQKHINTLDLQSEWVFTSSTGKLKMYSTSTPAITKICVIDTLLYTANYSNITIDGLTFEGAGYAAIFCENSNTIKIKNCIIRNAGQYGILIFNSPGITINNNQIYDVLGLAVYISNSVVSGNTVTNNYIKRSGCIPGLGWKSGGASDDSYSGMVVTGNGSIIQYNVIDSVGYKGISFGGSNVLVANNLVSNYCMVKDDGGGIYTWSNNGSPILTNRVVRDNIILNSIGAPNGTASSGPESHGIYMDGAAMNVDITGNTVINSSTDDAAIFFNNTSNIKVKANTLYNVAIGLLMNRLPDDVDLIRTMTVTGNIIYPTTSNFFYWNGSLNVPTTVNIQQDMRNMFTKIDSNYYRSDISDPFDWYYHLTNGGIFVDPLSQSLETWKTTINGDANSVNLPIGPNEIKYNPTSNPVEYNFSGFSKKDVYGNIYNNSVTIPAWSSKILIPNGITIAPNITPIANAGEDIVITLPTSIASLTGTGTDTDGIITSYKWSKIAGPDTGTINSPNSTVTSVNSLVAGVYLFELTVQDDRGAIAKDTVQLTVNIAANQLPVADAGADQIIVLPTNTTTLTGNGIDFDGTIASFSWAKIAGPSGGTIVSPNALTTEINNLAFGEFLYELSVTDNNGAVSADTVLIRVDSAINQAPVADAGSNLLINLPENSTLLKGTGTDVDGSVISYSWIQISGPTQGVIVSPGNDSTTISNLEQGTYIFELTVTDNHGAISSDIVQVAVNTGNFQAPPIAKAGTDQVITLPIDSIVLTGIGTDIDGTITNYKWVKISGPAWGSILSPNDTTTNVVGLVQGIYQYRLTVTDNAGANAKDTVTVTVMAAPNQPPVANAGTDTSITLPANSISIVGAGLDVDGTISSYNWVKIAGPVEGIIASPNSDNTSIYNLVQGVYKFELMVQDDKGLSSKDSIEITVNAAVNQLPETDAGTDQIIDLPINTTTLTGLGFDFDGTIVNYTWTKISGPAGGDIFSPDSAATVINNLVAGVFQFELSVKDNDGATTSDTIQITVNVAPKQAPVADAGANQLITLPVNSVTLTGSGTDADGTIISYSWAKILGPAAETLVSPNTASTQVNNLVQGLYEFELTVTDNDGLVSTDTIKITVNDALNKAPVAKAGDNKVISLPTNSSTLMGSGTDADGIITNFLWIKLSGPSQGLIESPNSAITVVSNLVQGDYKYELTVTDNNGAISKDIVTITVNPGQNQLPIADAGLDKIIVLPANNTILTGSGTDADGTIISYKWIKISGNAAGVIGSPNSATTTISNLIQGVNQYQLSVTDNKGAITKDTIKITVNAAPNQGPVANAGADKIVTLPVNSITLIGTGTDTDGTIASYAWEKIIGAVSVTISSPNSANTSISNLQQGVYQFVLTVADNNGAISKDTLMVTINLAPNQAPIADAGLNQIITLPVNYVNLSGSGNDDDGTITDYVWAIISGPAAGTIVSPNTSATQVNGLEKGVYKFELTVKDDRSAISKDTIEITVNPVPNKPPVAEAGGNKVITLPINNSSLSGSGTDTDGNIVSFFWKQIAGPVSGVIVSPTSANTIINNLIQGIYRYELTVTDNNGATATDIVQVTVNAIINILPIANAGADKTITLPTNNISLTGSGTDADGTITSYKWLKISGAASGTITSPNLNNTTITNLVQGEYQFQLTVTDNNGAASKDTIKLIVNAAPNMPPVLNAGIDKIITLPTNFLILTGTATDADGTISSYTWVKLSGPDTGSITSPNSNNTVITNLVQGQYQFQLIVTDNNGATGKDTIQVTVNKADNLAPSANAGFNKTIRLPINSTTLSGGGTDTDGTISSYTWRKLSGPSAGEIATANSATTTVTNLLQGIYQYELTVTDNNGASGKDTVQVKVNEAVNTNKIPLANAGEDINIVLPTNTVKLTGIGIDYDGTITSYKWRAISGPANFIFSSPSLNNTRMENLFQGVYSVELTVIDNLGAIAKDTLTITVSAPRLSNVSSNEFKVYSNPVRDIATLEINTVNAHTKLSVFLFDGSGKLLFLKEFVTLDRYTLQKLDMTNFSNGNYILNLRFDDGKVLNKQIFKYGGL